MDAAPLHEQRPDDRVSSDRFDPFADDDINQADLSPQRERELAAEVAAEDRRLGPGDIVFGQRDDDVFAFLSPEFRRDEELARMRGEVAEEVDGANFEDTFFVEGEEGELEAQLSDEAMIRSTAGEFEAFGLGDLETVDREGERVVQPTREAQERELLQQIEDEYPDAGEIEFRQDDGELVAEFEVQDRTVDDSIRDAVVGAATSPRETATTIGTAPFRAQVRFFSGVATTIQDPRGAAESAASSAVEGLSTAGDVVVSGITDPIDTEGLGGSATGTVREVGSRVDQGTPGEIQSEEVARLTGAATGARDDPSALVTEPAGVVGSAVTDPIDTGGFGDTATGTAMEVGTRIDEGTPGRVQPERVQALRQRPEIVLAGAGVVAPEPSTTVVGLGVLGGAAVAAGTTATQDDFATDFNRAEITLPEDRRVGVTGAEIGVPEDRRAGIRRVEVGIPDDRRMAVQQAEVGVPEDRRTAARQPEVGIPEDPIDIGMGDGPLIRTSPIGIQRQRQRERPFIDEEEEPFIISGEDLVDPEELRRREAEELREQVEQQAIFSETPAEEFDEEVEPLMTFGEPEVDLIDAGEREVQAEIDAMDVGFDIRPQPRERIGVGARQDQAVAQDSALDQLALAQPAQAAMGRQVQTVAETVPAQAMGQAFEVGFGQQFGRGARPPATLGIPLPDASPGVDDDAFDDDVTGAEYTDFIDPLTGDVLETAPDEEPPGFDALPGFRGLG